MTDVPQQQETNEKKDLLGQNASNVLVHRSKLAQNESECTNILR